MTHPFHPLNGRQLVCVGERYNRYGTRLLLRVDEDHVCSVPRQWTDVVSPEPELVIGEGRALLGVADLLQLADLVSRLIEQDRRAHECKANDAACVRQTLPRGNPGRRGGFPILCNHNTNVRGVPPLDSDPMSGVIIATTEREDPCRNETTAPTPRQRPSSRRAR